MMQLKSNRNFGPWNRKRKFEFFGNEICLHSSEEKFDTFTLANMELEINAKRVALKVAPSVVSLVSHSDGMQVFEGSGTIIDCVEENGKYWSSILTSATLLPRSNGSLTLASDIKIDVRLSTGRLVDGHVFAYDFHFNIASIKIQTSAPLPVATLRRIDDSISIVNPSNVQSFQLRAHSDVFKISPGDFVLAVGRYHKKPYDLMAAPGRFSLGSCKFECKQLFFADCKISKAGIGGPLVNQNGDVIGMNFYHEDRTPFLSINIASKGLDHFDKYQKFSRPWIGVELTNLYIADVAKLEKFNQKFPHTFVGVLVEQVVEGSPAAEAGLLSGDVITQCAGTLIRGFTEFFDVVLDNVGKVVKLVVLREKTGACHSIDLHIKETNQENFYSWPVPQESWEYASLR